MRRPTRASGFASRAGATLRGALEHRRAERLLPWHVNGTLAPVERRLVEGHLERCAACRRQAAHQRRLAALVAERPRPSIAPHPAKLHALEHRIEGMPPRRRPFHLLGGLPAPRTLWVLAATQAVALVLFGIVFVLERSNARTPAVAPYETLTEPRSESSSSEPRLRLVFAPAVTEEDMRELLAMLDGRIVDGPTPLGVYTIALPPAGGEEALQSVLDRLRQRPEIVFAEPSR